MAAEVGKEGEYESEINITPLVDISLVLVIVFTLLSVQGLLRETETLLPAVTLAPEPEARSVLEVRIDESGAVRAAELEDLRNFPAPQTDAEWTELARRMGADKSKVANRPTMIRADRRVEFREVKHVVDLLIGLGAGPVDVAVWKR